MIRIYIDYFINGIKHYDWNKCEKIPTTDEKQTLSPRLAYLSLTNKYSKVGKNDVPKHQIITNKKNGNMLPQLL